MTKKNEPGKLQITLVKSMIGRKQKHIEIAQQLGLRKIHQSRVVDRIPSILGMLDKIKYVLKIEEIQS